MFKKWSILKRERKSVEAAKKRSRSRRLGEQKFDGMKECECNDTKVQNCGSGKRREHKEVVGSKLVFGSQKIPVFGQYTVTVTRETLCTRFIIITWRKCLEVTTVCL